MNKVKMFFIAAAMVLTTAGVFAGKARFAAATNLYYSTNGISYFQGVGTLSGTNVVFNTTRIGSSPQITFTSSGSVVYGLYQSNGGGSYSPVYSGF